MRKWSMLWGALGGILCSAGIAFAHSRVTFGTGANISAANLNSNFQALFDFDHAIPGGNIVAGSITNNQISSSAAISGSKLATGGVVPKAWGVVGIGAACAGGGAADTPCAAFTGTNITEINASGSVGVYRVRLNYAPIDINFGMVVTAHQTDRICYTSGQAIVYPHFLINCTDADTPALGDSNSFTVIVFDNT